MLRSRSSRAARTVAAFEEGRLSLEAALAALAQGAQGGAAAPCGRMDRPVPGAGPAQRPPALWGAPAGLGAAASGALRASAAEQTAEQTPAPDEWLKPLDALVGLSEVKAVMREICAYAAVQRRRAEWRLKAAPTVRHMLFTGRPGTGKTTVARALGDIMRELHILPSGHLVEAERADLVGEYVGHTAGRTRTLVEKARGGILFIDEAYALARGGEKDFGREAIDTLVKGMEDHRDDMIVILAGYGREMQIFLDMNPGLRSRFPIQIQFPDFGESELMQIALRMAAERDYRLSADACATLRRRLRSERERASFANARTVRNLLEAAMRRQALRVFALAEPGRERLMELTGRDVGEEAAACGNAW